MWRIEFVSDEFQPYLPDDRQVNPGVYGFELAVWLSRALAGIGIATSYPREEDWGWYILYVDGDASYLIGCSSGNEDGYWWSIFVDPPKKRSWLGKSPVGAGFDIITGAIHTVLTEHGIAPSLSS